MILPLRRTHRRIMLALAIVLPLVLVLGIAARKPPAVMAELPDSLAKPLMPFETVVWERTNLFQELPVSTALLENRATGRFAVRLVAPPVFIKPDLLAYWSSTRLTETNVIPNDAILLGPVRFSSALILPDASNGSLILYSLADHTVIGVSSVIDLKKPASP